jgi:Flp pilus assembly protein TadD
LKTCPNCTTELVVDGGERCPVCNALLTAEAHTPSGSADDDLQFDVKEAHEDQRDLVGGTPRVSRRSELDIEDESHITAHQTPMTGLPTPDHASGKQPPAMNTKQQEPTASTPRTESNSIKRLTAEEVNSISKSLYGNQSYLSEKEKIAALKKVDASARNAASPGATNPDTAQMTDKPAMARRVRGIAWFYKNWVQIVGETDLREHEEMTIHDRQFVLRKKRFSPKIVLAIGAPLGAALLFVIASALTPSMSGKGRIVGCVFDDSGRPLQSAVTVKLPEDGQTFQTNAQGFFVTNPIKSGAHKIEVSIGGQVVTSDFATVVANEVTTVRLNPTPPPAPTAAIANQEESLRMPPPSQRTAPQDNRPARQNAEVVRDDSPEQAAQPTPNHDARLLLNASVDGATLSLDGKVVGAGNLAYPRLKPGQYLYLVSKTGYQAVGGSISLPAGKTTSLEVELTPLSTKTAAHAAKSLDVQHYQAGMDALAASDFATAEKEFAAAIEAKPDFPLAQMGLGDTKLKSGRRDEAHHDYLKAAESFYASADLSNALKAYNLAVQTNRTSAEALLGRGYLYLSRGEEIAAITDFEAAVALDKRNATAHLGLGRSRFAQGNPKSALKHFKDAKSADPRNPEIYEYLMLCYFASDNLKEAKKAYDMFIEIASADQVSRLHKDSKFSAVLRVVQE